MKTFRLISFLLICLFTCISMYSCTYDLEEQEGHFSTVMNTDGMTGTCDHIFQYSYTVYYADTNIYPAVQYHYVSCAKYGSDPFCDFFPRCEKHTPIDDSMYMEREMLAYNGHIYRVVPQVCSVCHNPAGDRYILKETEE